MVQGTRRPAESPPVPTDTQLDLIYLVSGNENSSKYPFNPTPVPRCLVPERAIVSWTQPTGNDGHEKIGIDTYRLIFRPFKTLPIGYYGQDTANMDERKEGHLPVSQARTLSNDVIVEWKSEKGKNQPVNSLILKDKRRLYFHSQFSPDQNSIDTLIDVLISHKLVPQKDTEWKPVCYKVYLQTVSAAGVKSSLTAVKVNLQFVNEDVLVSQNSKLPFEPLNVNAVHSQPMPPFEERQVQTMEWLTNPLKSMILGTEDTAEKHGSIRIPLPPLSQPSTFENLNEFNYAQHPRELRCVRFTWNQGPSQARGYRNDLHSGYRVYEFDAFKHSGQLLESEDIDPVTNQRKGKPLYLHPQFQHLGIPVQFQKEIELISSDDLPGQPANTLDTGNWEVWFPSNVRRLERKKNGPLFGSPPKNSTSPYSPWFSWRESVLKWPIIKQSDMLNKNKLRIRQRHPVLDQLLENIEQIVIKTIDRTEPGNSADFDNVIEELSNRNLTPVDGLPLTQAFFENQSVPFRLNKPYAVQEIEKKQWRIIDLNGILRIRLKTKQLEILQGTGYQVEQAAFAAAEYQKFKDARRGTDNQADPYGWRILSQMGLCVSFRVRNLSSGQLMSGADAWKMILDADNSSPWTRFINEHPESQNFKAHFFFDLLFQTNKWVELDPNVTNATEEAMTNLLQISLRPLVEQVRRYGVYVIDGTSGEQVTFKFNLPGAPTTVPVLADLATNSGEAGITREIDLVKEEILTYEMPASGRLELFLRFKKSEIGDPQNIKLHRRESDQSFIEVLQFDIQHPLVTDYVSSLFSIPTEEQDFSQFSWWSDELDVYLNVLGQTKDLPADNSFHKPTNGGDEATQQVIAQTMEWLQRFFDYGNIPQDLNGNTEIFQHDLGWFTTGSLRSPTVVMIAPDENGRVHYDHVIDNPWGAASRYFVIPLGRYDLIWEALLQSEQLLSLPVNGALPDAREILKKIGTVDYMADTGGVDVVLPRQFRLEPPLILHSSRLDEPSTPSEPAPPGQTWEVIVQKHPEQILAERNLTLKNRLSYEQIIHAHFRRFQQTEKVSLLQDVLLKRYRTEKFYENKNDKKFFDPSPANSYQLTVKLNGAEIKKFTISDDLNSNTLEKILELFREKLREVRSRIVQIEGKYFLEMMDGKDRTNLVELFIDGGTTSLLAKVEPREPQLIDINYPENTLNDEMSLPEFEDFQPGIRRKISYSRPLLKKHPLTSDAALTLDIPLRMSDFSNQAIIYQYEGLPYFYEQKLLLAAQAGNVVSQVISTTQHDFYYQSPIPIAYVEGIINPKSKKRLLNLEVKLKRFWDCLDEDGQTRWEMESPEIHKQTSSMSYKPAALPDLEVNYQLILSSPGGVIEMVGDISFNDEAELIYLARSISPGYKLSAISLFPANEDEEYFRLQTNLIKVKSEGVTPDVTEVITSRHDLKTAAQLPAESAKLFSFPTPGSLAMRLSGYLLDEGKSAITWITENIPLDEAMKKGLKRLLAQLPECITTRVIEQNDIDIEELRKDLDRVSGSQSGMIEPRLMEKFFHLGFELSLQAMISKTVEGWTIADGQFKHFVIDHTASMSVEWQTRLNQVDISVGLEHLEELSNPSKVTVPHLDSTDRKLIWAGAMTVSERRALWRIVIPDGTTEKVTQGWSITSDVSEILTELLKNLSASEINVNYTGSSPPASIIPDKIKNHLSFDSPTVTWRDFILVPIIKDGQFVTDEPTLKDEDVKEALQKVIDDTNTSHPEFSQAVASIQKQLGLSAGGTIAEVEVDMSNTNWTPRVRQQDLDKDKNQGLPDEWIDQFQLIRHSLSLGYGNARFQELMTSKELQTLLAPSLHPFNQTAMSLLYGRSLFGNLEGQRLRIRAKKGSARPVTRELELKVK